MRRIQNSNKQSREEFQWIEEGIGREGVLTQTKLDNYGRCNLRHSLRPPDLEGVNWEISKL